MPTFLTFDATDSEPHRSTGNDEAPGRGLAESFVNAIGHAGIIIQEPVEENDSYGWAFTARVDDVPIWCMVQESDNWLVTIEPHLPILKRLKGKKGGAEQSRLCAALDQFVQSDSRFSSIQWYASEVALRSIRDTPSITSVSVETDTWPRGHPATELHSVDAHRQLARIPRSARPPYIFGGRSSIVPRV